MASVQPAKPDGSIVFTVNGDITANTLRAGGAIYQNNGDIFGSVWGMAG